MSTKNRSEGADVTLKFGGKGIKICEKADLTF